MIIATLNFSGSVGKTLISNYLLKPRMPEAKFLAIETINESAADLGTKDIEQFKGSELRNILQSIMLESEAIIDIGASNVESFLIELEKYSRGLKKIDRFVIPVTPDRKAQNESLKTAEALSVLGIPAEKILFLPNRIQSNMKTELGADFIARVYAQGFATLHDTAYIREMEVYQWLSSHRRSFEELLAGQDKYLSEAKKAAKTDPERSKALVAMAVWADEAGPVHEHMNRVFAELFTTEAA
jgi:MinD-like ATPase involved in chromosome partitioning or flagellar assembly